MKRPYFNRQQRIAIYCDTMEGSHLMLNLAVKKLLRNVRITKGWVAMKKAERIIVILVNIKLFGIYTPKKWWQLF